MRLVSVVLFFGLTAAVATISAQSHDDRNLPLGGPSVAAAVRYSITATAMPDSATVRGLAEVLFENRGDTALWEVRWDAGQPLSYEYTPPEQRLGLDSLDVQTVVASPLGAYCRLDSVLYLGAPCRPEQIALDGTTMVITLDVPIASGDKGFFLVFFEASLAPNNDSSDPVVYNHWFPMIAATAPMMHERSDIQLRLEVDSSYDLIYPGELMNAKELQGLLPKLVPDSVYIDIVERYQIEYGGVRYHPTFESGCKRFYVRLGNATGLPVVFEHALARDRIMVDSTVIEYSYRRGSSKHEPGLIANRAAKIVHRYLAWLGDIPLKYINIVSFSSTESLTDVSLVALPERSADSDLITGVLAIRLAQLWFTPTMSAENERRQYVDEGLAVYMAMRALCDLFPGGASSMFDKAQAWLHDNGFAGEEPDFPFHTIPACLQMFRFAAGDSILWSLLADYAAEHRYGFAPGALSIPPTITAAVADCPDIDRLLAISDADFDLAITAATPVDAGIEITLTNRGSLRLPIEIAVVYGPGDTLFDTLQCSHMPEPGETTTVSIPLSRPARCAILDPHYLLMDIDRRNNVMWLQRTRDRWLPPDNLFPGYRQAAAARN